MKKFTSLSLILTAAAGFAFTQAAHASDEDGSTKANRFNFAPNIYKVEEPTGGRYRHALATFAPPASVRSGSVPKVSSVLGDPSFIKAVTPVAQPTVVATVVPKPAQLPKDFQSVFGKPISQVPLVAHNATPLAFSPTIQPKAAARIAPRRTAAMRPVVAHSSIPSHGPIVQSYGPAKALYQVDHPCPPVSVQATQLRPA